MFCSKCGNKQPENSGAFCSKCGHKQKEDISQSISPPRTQPPPKQYVQPPQPQHYQQASPPVQNNVVAKGGKKGVIPTIIGVILVVLGFMGRSDVMDHPAVRWGHFNCGLCDDCFGLSVMLGLSMAAIFVGIIVVIVGIARLLKK